MRLMLGMALFLAGCGGERTSDATARTPIPPVAEAAPSAPSRDVTPDPAVERLVRELYASYTDDGSDPVPLFGAGADRLLTAEFIAADRADEARSPDGLGALDFDPVIQGQDFTGVTVTDVSTRMDGPDAATARVAFTNASRASTTVFKVRRVADGWRIDDISVPGDPAGGGIRSVKTLLATGEDG